VPDISDTEIPKPQDWQAFQRGCVILFRCLLGDPSLLQFGSEGQAQHGIDLHGYRNADTARPVGIQCRRLESQLTEKKMRKDVEEARQIKPALSEFIFATTTKRDKNLSLAAAALTEELKASGWNCRVTFMSWPDLQHEISQHPDALRAFWPTFAESGLSVIAAVKDTEINLSTKLEEHTATVLREFDKRLGRAASAAMDEYDADLAPEARQESVVLHTRISEARKLIGKGKSRTALETFQELEQTELPPYARHRVLANIGAIHFNAGRNAEALDYFRRALDLRPDDPKAATNLAYAELIGGNLDGARARAASVLKAHPDHAGAASLIIQSHQANGEDKDPFALVPEATHDTAEVLIAAIVYLRARDDHAWMALAEKAAEKHPKDRHLSRFAAEAIVEPALSDREVIFGKRIEGSTIEAVKRAAATLQDLWAREMQLEEVRGEEALPLANNAAAALRFIGDDAGAAHILDETLAKVARDPDLVRARALLHLHADENEKAADLLQSIDDPEGTLFLAQLTAAKEPERAKAALERLDAEALKPELRAIVPEVRGEIAISQNDKDEFAKALEQLQEQAAPFENIAILRARGIEKGLIAPSATEADEEEDQGPSPVVANILEELPRHEASLSFAARVQLAQFLERHNADEAASDLLYGRIDLDRDTISLRTYLAASIGAQLFARAREVLAALPPPLLEIPAYARMAATYHWNVGDAKAAEPFIARLSAAAPQRLDLFLWHIDALIRTHAEDRVKEMLKVPVEAVADGSVSDKRRLVAALTTYGQLPRARAFAYKLFALNRDEPGAWMSFMGTMLTGEKPEKDPILDPVVGPDHAIELRLSTGEQRRFVIESDPDVRKVLQDAIAPDHEIARLVQGLKPGDEFNWPGEEVVATITASKHKLLDAFHTAIGLFNARFPNAKGFKQVRVGTAEAFDISEIEKMLRERSAYIDAQTRKYEEGHISLSMLAHLCGLDPVDAMIGLAELRKPYRVAVGTREEREGAISALRNHKAAGCIVDAATYHCIRRLGLEDAVKSVCGPIGITQVTADIYHVRVQSLDDFGGEPKGSMTMRDGRMQMVEYSPEYLATNRRIVESDRDWLAANAEVLPANPKQDPPAAMRRLSAVPGARFFDDIFAASGSSRLLVTDDLFTRQAGYVLGVASTSLQPILMVARDRAVISPEHYARAITDLIEMGQKSIGIDAAALIAARKLDLDSGERRVGPRLATAALALGGPACDPASHCSVAAEFTNQIMNRYVIDLDDYAAVSHVLSAVLRSRTADYREMLNGIDKLLAGNAGARRYLREWARGHFLL
jgi:tetratricopeptide (TPR) repeat protein